MSEDKKDIIITEIKEETSSEVSSSDKSGTKEEFSNLHPLRARLYDNVNLSLNTMNIIVAVVAVLLLAVFFYGVFTGSGINLG